MAKKWTNENLPGVLHYVTGNVDQRRQIFLKEQNCISFLEELRSVMERRESKLVCFVVMPDHFHLIVNPRDGDIQTWIGELKSFSAKSLVRLHPDKYFAKPEGENQVWQESFKSLALWSGWMIWQKINDIHSNPLRAGLVDATLDYRWSSFKSFYGQQSDELLMVDQEWWYEDDLQKLKKADGREERGRARFLTRGCCLLDLGESNCSVARRAGTCPPSEPAIVVVLSTLAVVSVGSGAGVDFFH